MLEIEKWALKQFRRVLSSPIHLAEHAWGHDELLGALTYTKLLEDSELVSEVRNLIGYHLQMLRSQSTSVFFNLLRQGANSISINLRCLYKHNTLKAIDPVLFGFVFCSVLSEGYKSSLWANLTLEDRSKLLAAQVYLTPLPLVKLHLSWVKKPSEILRDIQKEDCAACFPECSHQFTSTTFPNAFDTAYIGRLQANTPLTGVSALRELPKRRHDISQSFYQISWECEKDCGKHLIHALDSKIDSVFAELSHSYHDKIR